MFTVSATRPAAQQASFDNMTASNQWANRPASERFWTVADLRNASHSIYMNSAERILPVKGLEVITTAAILGMDEKQDLALQDKNTGARVRLNNWSFGQLCARLKCPASWLRTLSSEDVALLLNKYGIDKAANDDTLAIWRHRGELIEGMPINTALAVTSEKYGRIPNWQVCDSLLSLGDEYRVPPARPNDNDPRARPATAEDILSGNKMGLSIREGDMIAPAGVYGDDRSIFVFLVNENRPVEVSDTETMFRGFYVQNSEVGSSALKFTIFDYITVCGNHIIWGCKNVQEVSIRHVGKTTVQGRFREAFSKINTYLNADTSREQNAVRIAKGFMLGADSEKVIDYVAERVDNVSKKVASAAFDLAEQYSDISGNPCSAWGFAAGLTRLSQTLPNTDERDKLDRAARKVLQIAGAFNE
jgi:hypothetical protein